MGFFDLFKTTDINAGIDEYKAAKNAVLLDVRSADEYASGHIPDSRNIDVSRIGAVSSIIKDKTTPVFVYCLSGARSNQAVSAMKSMGYTNVKSIGGISKYKGKIVKK